MSAADRAAATAAQFGAATPRPEQAEGAAKTKIRTTVDMRPARYHKFVAWCAEYAAEQGQPTVSRQDVVNVLIARLLTDETLSRKIKEDMRSYRW